MPPLLARRDGGLLILCLNRPERLNALDDALIHDLAATLSEAAADPNTRCVLITGAGKGFCTGYDISLLSERHEKERPEDSARRFAANLERTTEIARALHTMPKPTIAAVNGAAAGAGLALALACDLRLASESARFTTAFARIGVSGDAGMAYFLTQIAGSARARELLFMSETFSTASALEWGVLHQLYAADRLMEEGEALARKLATGPTEAFGRMKENLKAAANNPFDEALALEHHNMLLSLQSRDCQEGVQAFLDRRAPQFHGR